MEPFQFFGACLVFPGYIDVASVVEPVLIVYPY